MLMPRQRILYPVCVMFLLAFGGCGKGNQRKVEAPSRPSPDQSRVLTPDSSLSTRTATPTPDASPRKTPRPTKSAPQGTDVTVPAKRKVARPMPPAVDPRVAARQHTLFDFVTNAHRAHLVSPQGLWVRTDTVGFFKYTMGRWKSKWLFPNKKMRYAMTNGRQSLLRFPLDPGICKRGCKLHLRLRAAVAKQRVGVFLNGKSLDTYSFSSQEWVTVSVKVPADAVQAGENKLRLFFRAVRKLGKTLSTAATLQAVALTPASSVVTFPEQLPPMVTRTGKIRWLSSSYRGYEYYLDLPRGADLKIAAMLRGKKAAAGTITVTSYRGKSLTKRFELSPDAPTRSLTIDLAALAGAVAKIAFVAADGKIAWRPTLVSAPRAPRIKGKLPPVRHVFIWIVDTLRADRLRAYNPKSRVRTPNYDAFIKDAVLFKNATVQGSHSIPSHASILTGNFPGRHRMYNDKSRHPASTVLLQELFLKAGYYTGAFLSNGYVSKKWGYGQGWKFYKNYIRDNEPAHTGYMWPRLKRWITQHKDKRLMMYLATVDPHVAYRYRKEFTTLYDDKPYKGPFMKYCSGQHLDRIRSGRLKLTARDKARMLALYDGEITFNDKYFGEFVATLKALGMYDASVIVITSDHGDEFFEHDSVGHGHSLHREMIDVPLIIKIPGVPGGITVPDDVDLVDIVPTMVAAARIETSTRFQGWNLLALIRDANLRVASTGIAHRGRVTRSLKIGQWKYIVRDPDTDFVYDYTVDPGEKTNVREKFPIARRYLRDVISLYLAFEKEWDKGRWGSPNNVTPLFVKETR